MTGLTWAHLEALGDAIEQYRHYVQRNPLDEVARARMHLQHELLDRLKRLFHFGQEHAPTDSPDDSQAASKAKNEGAGIAITRPTPTD